jgi:integrase
MPRKKEWPPLPKQRGGNDVLRLRVGGRVSQVTLGPTGSPQAREEYVRILAEIEAHGRVLTRSNATTVGELADQYLDAVEKETEPRTYRRALRAVRGLVALYGGTPAVEFGPLALKAVRGAWEREGKLCRQYVNKLTDEVTKVFRWGAENEVIDPARVGVLKVVRGLRKRKTAAPEAPKIRPADVDMVKATLPHLPPIVADMVRLQLVAGMRPGEVCAICPADVDRQWLAVGGKAVWLVRLDDHKTAWKGHHRWIPLGPQAQAILAPYLEDRDPDAPCFSPREVAEASAVSRGRTFRTDRKRVPGERYDTCTFDKTILRACKRAFPPPQPLAKRPTEHTKTWLKRIGQAGLDRVREWEKAHAWRPNQLRHTRATEIETQFGREDAAVPHPRLGPTSPQRTRAKRCPGWLR